MRNIKITCSNIERINLAEGLRVEFKTSIFYSAECACQPEVIARTIASFINTEGGDLYLGIRDDGVIVGVASDLEAMAHVDKNTIITGPYASDVGYTCKANVDQYYLKLQKIVEAYIGKDALRFLCDIKSCVQGGLTYVVVPVRKAGRGEFVRFKGASARFSEVLIRSPGSTRLLLDVDRDDFVMRKARESNDTGELLIKTMRGLLGQQGDDLKRILSDVLKESDKSAKSMPQEVSALPLIKRIQDAIARVAVDRRVDVNHVDLKVEIDEEESTLSVMDSFQRKENGNYKYTRMIITRYSLPFTAMPYISVSHYYKKIPDTNFELHSLEWIVQRLSLTPQEAAVIEAMGRVISISDIKRNNIQRLKEFVFEDCLDDLRKLDYGEASQIDFKDVFLLRANTTYSHADMSNNLFQIVGVKCVKEKLRECPNSTEGLGWWKTTSLLRGVWQS